MLDNLYWVMSYSRWKDERFWPLFRNALLREHPRLTPEALGKAREFNLRNSRIDLHRILATARGRPQPR